MTAILNQKNGSKPVSDWLQSPVNQFFNSFNWDDHPPEVQAIKRSAQNDGTPLSLTLSVSHFFDSIAWDGDAASATPELPANAPPDDKFTLDDFSNLF